MYKIQHWDLWLKDWAPQIQTKYRESSAADFWGAKAPQTSYQNEFAREMYALGNGSEFLWQCMFEAVLRGGLLQGLVRTKSLAKFMFR